MLPNCLELQCESLFLKKTGIKTRARTSKAEGYVGRRIEKNKWKASFSHWRKQCETAKNSRTYCYNQA